MMTHKELSKKLYMVNNSNFKDEETFNEFSQLNNLLKFINSNRNRIINKIAISFCLWFTISLILNITTDVTNISLFKTLTKVSLIVLSIYWVLLLIRYKKLDKENTNFISSLISEDDRLNGIYSYNNIILKELQMSNSETLTLIELETGEIISEVRNLITNKRVYYFTFLTKCNGIFVKKDNSEVLTTDIFNLDIKNTSKMYVNLIQEDLRACYEKPCVIIDYNNPLLKDIPKKNIDKSIIKW